MVCSGGGKPGNDAYTTPLCIGDAANNIRVHHLNVYRTAGMRSLCFTHFCSPLAFPGKAVDARLMDLFSSPFDDLKLAALTLADGMAKHPWGQKVRTR